MMKCGDITKPDTLTGAELDEFLAKGWFRMGQHVFTCKFLNHKRRFCSAIWLRINLDEFEIDSTFRKLSKLNAGFDIKIRTACITDEKELLYSKYKTAVKFDTPASLSALLYDNWPTNIFNTYEICIYDHGKLIGVGFFDLGEKAVQGIVSFYDPDYKKNSIGKYLIYNKMIYSKKAGYTYFYPGYFAPNYPVFDYKINIGKSALYYFDIFSNHWIHYIYFSATNTPIEILQSKMLLMEKVLRSHEIKCAKLGNEFYNANNIGHLRDIDFFDYPEFIFVLSNNHPGFTPIIVFDVIKNVFIMVKCYSWYHDTKYISDGHYFGEHLMKIEEVIFTSSNENDFPNLFITTDTAQE